MTEQATETMPCRLTFLCAETSTFSAGVGCEIVVPGLDDSGVEPLDECRECADMSRDSSNLSR